MNASQILSLRRHIAVSRSASRPPSRQSVEAAFRSEVHFVVCAKDFVLHRVSQFGYTPDARDVRCGLGDWASTTHDIALPRYDHLP
ncbi:MAG: hypothetical protein ABJC26_10645 [Gemmatimonadaceae bacterium]